jgi:hypothetical protein
MSAVDLRKPSKETPVPDFERIDREYSPLVYRTAYGVLGNSQDAEDVLQTIFLLLARRRRPRCGISGPSLGDIQHVDRHLLVSRCMASLKRSSNIV